LISSDVFKTDGGLGQLLAEAHTHHLVTTTGHTFADRSEEAATDERADQNSSPHTRSWLCPVTQCWGQKPVPMPSDLWAGKPTDFSFLRTDRSDSKGDITCVFFSPGDVDRGVLGEE